MSLWFPEVEIWDKKEGLTLPLRHEVDFQGRKKVEGFTLSFSHSWNMPGYLTNSKMLRLGACNCFFSTAVNSMEGFSRVEHRKLPHNRLFTKSSVTYSNSKVLGS